MRSNLLLINYRKNNKKNAIVPVETHHTCHRHPTPISTCSAHSSSVTPSYSRVPVITYPHIYRFKILHKIHLNLHNQRFKKSEPAKFFLACTPPSHEKVDHLSILKTSELLCVYGTVIHHTTTDFVAE